MEFMESIFLSLSLFLLAALSNFLWTIVQYYKSTTKRIGATASSSSESYGFVAEITDPDCTTDLIFNVGVGCGCSYSIPVCFVISSYSMYVGVVQGKDSSYFIICLHVSVAAREWKWGNFVRTAARFSATTGNYGNNRL
jgi:uncharacterized membrane protein